MLVGLHIEAIFVCDTKTLAVQQCELHLIIMYIRTRIVCDGCFWDPERTRIPPVLYVR
jgi:hypothetical protein